MFNVSRTMARTIAPVLALSLTALSAAAQTNAEDEGTFEILVNGRLAGTEDFSIRQTGVGSAATFIATGRVQVLLPTGSLDLAPRLRAAGFQADPVAYELTVAGDASRRIVGSIGDGRFSARIVTTSGEQLREYVAGEGATIVDDGIAHHYYFLVRRTRSGTVPILIPRENRQVMAQVVDAGEDQLSIRGTQVTLYHLIVTPTGSGPRHIWSDALGRIIRVEIPDQNYVATRTELPR